MNESKENEMKVVKKHSRRKQYDSRKIIKGERKRICIHCNQIHENGFVCENSLEIKRMITIFIKMKKVIVKKNITKKTMKKAKEIIKEILNGNCLFVTIEFN